MNKFLSIQGAAESLGMFLFFIFLAVESQAEFAIPMIHSGHPQAQVWGYDDGNFETNGEEFVLRALLTPEAIVFDVGANIGLWSLTALQIEPKICLYAFEPVPKTFQTLITKIPFPSKIYHFAFSNQLGRGKFYALEGEESPGSGFFLRPHLARRSLIIEVDLETVDHFCEVHHINKIDYLKIDTEGGELRVLEGAKTMLANHYITALQFEYGGTYPDAKITLKEVMRLLAQAGYVIFRLSPHGIIHIDCWNDSLENYRYANYFGVIPSLVPDCSSIKNL